ncbi:MAG: D-sedoheptulose 7-phosphate isomerase [Candidatus Omnitrophica bacterium]|nr:D-sedoheptulose 7-phosphate isomerase [Candidatus Omnitrophota bacterium]
MKEKIKKLISESIHVKDALATEQAENIASAARMAVDTLRSGGKILIFGNGGSAADSQHIAAELVGRFKKERPALAAIALTTDSSIISALANDYGYDVTFARQIEALGRKGDLAIGLSTSGNSANVILAIKKAKTMGLATVCLTGSGGGKLKSECDVAIVVPSKETARIQEAHILIGHIICELIEEEVTKK